MLLVGNIMAIEKSILWVKQCSFYRRNTLHELFGYISTSICMFVKFVLVEKLVISVVYLFIYFCSCWEQCLDSKCLAFCLITG